MSQLNAPSLEIKFKNSMLNTKEEQEKYFSEEFGSVAKIFVNWRESRTDDFGRHLFPLENLEKMMRFYQNDKLQPKISMLLQILGRCSEEDIGLLLKDLKKHEATNQVASNIDKMRDNQPAVRPLNTKF